MLQKVTGIPEDKFRRKNKSSLEVDSVGTQSQREYLLVVWKNYKKMHDRKEKGKILDELVRNLSLNRKSAIRLMSSEHPPRGEQGKRGGRRRRYSEESKRHLEQLWKSMGYIAPVRMKAAMPEWLTFYEGRGFSEEIRTELLAMSESSIKRFLGKARAELRRKLNTGTRRGVKRYLSVVPIRDLEATPQEPGHCEVDCVAHCGGSMSGQFAWTVNLTDIASGWTECEAIWAKNGVEVRRALLRMESRLPFKLKALYCDNGNEFMNKDIIEKFAVVGRDKKLPVFRGRPYRKNDQCYVEQKNYTHVRQLFGYGRMNWKPGVKMMNTIYRKEWRLLQNLYLPQQKLIEKACDGSKIIRTMDDPKTPFERLREHLSPAEIKQIELLKRRTNPFQLRHNQRIKTQRLNGYFKSEYAGQSKGRMAV